MHCVATTDDALGGEQVKQHRLLLCDAGTLVQSARTDPVLASVALPGPIYDAQWATDELLLLAGRDGALQLVAVDAARRSLQPRATLADIRGGTPAENAAALTRLLAGETGAYRNIVLLNAGAALVVAGRAADLKAGVAQAAAAIDDGRAQILLGRLAGALA